MSPRKAKLRLALNINTIATMVGGSGGTEPEFALSYTRRTDNLEEQYQVESKVVQDYRRTTKNYGDLPEYFVTSADIPWKARIDTQAIIQQHIDTAISSTVNLPKETTLEEIEQLYLYAWKQGLKGVTIFRDGCKRMGILTTETDDKESDRTTVNADKTDKLQRGTILSVSDDLIGAKRKLTTGCGSLHLETYFDELTGEPMETFINIGSSGGCERNLQLISRLMSLALRAGVPIEAIIDQCKSIKPCPAYTLRTQKKGDTSKGSSCPSAIGFALEELYAKIKDRCFADEEEETEDSKEENTIYKSITSAVLCPECGETLTFEGGCKVCHSCGYSKCE